MVNAFAMLMHENNEALENIFMSSRRFANMLLIQIASYIQGRLVSGDGAAKKIIRQISINRYKVKGFKDYYVL